MEKYIIVFKREDGMKHKVKVQAYGIEQAIYLAARKHYNDYTDSLEFEIVVAYKEGETI